MAEVQEQNAPEKQTPPRRRTHRWRWLRLLLLLPLVLVIGAIALLYVPGVLNFVAGKVLPSVEKSTGMHIELGNLSLRFPLTLSLEDATVIQRGDTMLTLERADVNVRPMALLGGKLKIGDATVRNAFYQMGGPDSLYVRALIDSVGATATLNLAFDHIDVKHADLNGARVLLLMGPDTTASPKDSVSNPIYITSGPISIRNLDYTMSMRPAGDTIAARVSEAILSDGHLITGDTIDIRAGLLQMSVNHGLYGKIGAEPIPGFDLNWIEMTDGEAIVDGFTMHGSALTVPLKKLSLRERCGLDLSAKGVFSMDSTRMDATNFDLRANDTRLTLDAMMGLDSVAAKTPLKVRARASVMSADIARAMPALIPVLAPLPSDKPLNIAIGAKGTMAQLSIDTIAAAMDQVFFLRGSGDVSNFSDLKNLRADAALSGSLINPAPVNAMLPRGSGIHVPPLKLTAKAGANGSAYSADLTATTGAGRLALKGSLSGSAPLYNADLRLDSFPVNAFMPDLGIGAVSGSVKASGRGFNPLARGAKLKADVNVRSIDYQGNRLGGVTLTAALDTSLLRANLRSEMPAARVNLTLNSLLRPKMIGWDLNGRIDRLDLMALHMTDSVLNAAMTIDSRGAMFPNLDSIRAKATIRNLDLNIGQSEIKNDYIDLTLDAGQESTLARLQSKDLNLDFDAQEKLTNLGTKFASAASMASKMAETRIVNADSLAATLPDFRLTLKAGPQNIINDYLRPQNISFSNLVLSAGCNSLISLNAIALNVHSGESLAVDSLAAIIYQTGTQINLDIDMDNKPGTFDEFAHVCLQGKWNLNRGDFALRQQNIQGKTGYEIGFGVTTTDSLITLSFNELNPIIAYKNWTINKGNYITLNTEAKRIAADLTAEGSDSRLQLTAQPGTPDSSGERTDDVTLKVDNVHIQDWLKINPFAPPMAGDASAFIKLHGGKNSINGEGTVSLENLTYGKQRVGDLDLDLDVKTDRSGFINAEATMDVNGQKALALRGVMNDTTRTEPLVLTLRLTELPLSIANPFLPKEYAALSGALNGHMDVTGKLSEPILNGDLSFHQARVKVGMIGSSFTFDSIAVPVDSNVVRFDNFAITGSNANPLRIDGSVDLRSFSKPRLNLALNASNMQIINSKKGKNVNIYGRAFIDLDATVRGTMQFLRVDANLALLPQTNVTYAMESAGASAIGLQNDNDMVRFVNFADTAATHKADTIAAPSMLMTLNALVDIRQGSTVTVDLSSDGQNRAQIKGEGILDYSMSPAQPDGRLTGRFTINSGFFRYSLPVISEKNFSFNQGSYVAFNGPILNPTLNIYATDDIKANVTRSGENSRLVIFDVILGVTGTLERMDVAFDLETNDDITVQNELRSMSATQRANQAMNLLLYGVYTGQGTTGNANLSGNALYGFLTSQLNTWAANTIKGVDLSFGMDQYDRTRDGSTSTATQYSYQLSKSLFNDRFKIVVGGNYSTDANAEENFAQNLISDISFEYMLNDAGSMYVRLFRHTGYESILEGEVTQTGVGFVMRRKIRSLRDLFIFRKKSAPKK